MKTLMLTFFTAFIFSYSAQAEDFWHYAAKLDSGATGSQNHSWGTEEINYLGTVTWMSPSRKEKTIRIVTCWRKIKKVNGFSDECVLALVKTDHELIIAYDMVTRLNLPIRIEDNNLVFKPARDEILSPLPSRFAERFCAKNFNCFNEMDIKPDPSVE